MLGDDYVEYVNVTRDDEHTGCGADGPARRAASRVVEHVNVTRDDVHVLQCNASNQHGYLFANAFLNVLGAPHCRR